MKRYGSILLNAALLVFGICGQYFTLHGTPGFMQRDSLLYYTMQSNLLVMGVAVLTLVFELRRLGGRPIPPVVCLIRLVGTVAITLTFVVFSLMLTPPMLMSGGFRYLLTPGNLCVHNLVPIAAILDWCLFGSAKGLRRGFWGFCLIAPGAYAAFALIRSALGLRISGQHVPYFFLDYKRFGWLRIGGGGIGVVYWILILCAALIGMAFAFAAIARKREARQSAAV